MLVTKGETKVSFLTNYKPVFIDNTPTKMGIDLRVNVLPLGDLF